MSEKESETEILLRQAIRHHQKGQVDAAEALYQRILNSNPQHPDALHLLGIIHHGKGDYQKSLELIGQAVILRPHLASFQNSLGNTLLSLKNYEEARKCYEQALLIQPDYPDALSNLAHLEYLCHHDPAAEVLYRKVIEIQPGKAEAFFQLGRVLFRLGKLSQAAEAFGSSIALRPNHSDSYLQLAMVLHALGMNREIVIILRRLMEFDRNNPKAWTYLTSAYETLTQYVDALNCIQEAEGLFPNEPIVIRELGNVYYALGDLERARESVLKALEINPNLPETYSQLLFIQTHSPDVSPEEQFREHRAWADRFEAPYLGLTPVFPNSPEPERKLRIGYVSPDFKKHSVAYFIEPVLMSHDTSQYETYCYMSSAFRDKTTERIQSVASHWRSIAGVPDEGVLEILREDQPDILVDLSGHTSQNRLPLFARRAAPIQVAWIGYPNTTGMTHMDYRLVDKWTDPEGIADDFHSEKLIRLPHGFSVYLPPSDSPAPVEELPADERGWILFASFNNLPKINDRVVETWSAILNRVPGSRLLIKCKQMGDEATRKVVASRFAKWGISEGRILNMSYVAETAGHLEAYNQVDIGLDTFPFNGATTTHEAVWMGVPVITLAGERHAGRVGVSILNRLGMPELIADTREEYIQIAVDLAHDRDRLRKLRTGMRQRVLSSSLVDKVLITRSVEEAYRKMWREWCTLERQLA